MIPGRPNLPLPFGADPCLDPFRDDLRRREAMVERTRLRLGGGPALPSAALAHHYFGLHRSGDEWLCRE